VRQGQRTDCPHKESQHYTWLKSAHHHSFSLLFERNRFIKQTMANIEIGGPPGLQPVALQLPYAADPGTLTEWLLRDTAREPASSGSIEDDESCHHSV
jgi:hypothetical protein